MKPNSQTHIAIIGAGITGTTLAVALARRHIPFTVYEQSPCPTELGAGLGFGPNAARAMRIVDRGLHEAFLRVCTPRDMRTLSVSGQRGDGVREGGGLEDEKLTVAVRGGSQGAGEFGGGGGGGGGLGQGRGEVVGNGIGRQEEEPVWIEFLDGTSDTDPRELEPAFKVFARHGEGHGAVHRARWLEVLMGMVPEGSVRFGKRLAGVEDKEGGKVVLRFEDGTTAEVDAVVGCDGVKSKVREVVVGGREREGAKGGYSGKYAYRCMIPMERAVEEMGEVRAGCSSLWMGHGRHVLTFPVGNLGPGQLLNLVAFVTDSNESWPSKDARSLTLSATRDDALRDFEQGGFGTTVQNLLRLIKDKMDKWGLFDLADHPLPTFYSGRVLVIGDAAHASTPHHGSGAGFCMEDVAVLSSLLDALAGRDREQSDMRRGVEAVFAAFDASRRERDQWLVQSSRRAADLYEWRLPDTGKEFFERMREDIQGRQAVCWGVDLDAAIREAKDDLHRRLEEEASV